MLVCFHSCSWPSTEGVQRGNRKYCVCSSASYGMSLNSLLPAFAPFELHNTVQSETLSPISLEYLNDGLLVAVLRFCRVCSSRPLAAVLCKSSHPSISSAGNVFCTSLLLTCPGSPKPACGATADLSLSYPVQWQLGFSSEKSLLWDKIKKLFRPKEEHSVFSPHYYCNRQ